MKTGISKEYSQDPLGELKSEFALRRSKNHRYSLRSFSKDLCVSPGQLSKILNGRSSMTHLQAARFAAALNLPKAEAKRWVETAIINAPPNAKLAKRLKSKTLQAVGNRNSEASEVQNLAVDRFKAIASWYHLAILELTYLKNFSADPAWIAKQLQVSLFEAKDALVRLTELGLLEKCPHRGLKKTDSRLFIPSRSEPEVRQFQHQMIQKADQFLAASSVPEMDRGLINSITFPANYSAIPEIRDAIFQFQKKILRMIKNSEYTDVYQLNCQLFPIVKTESK